jgi:hypothetical protein
LIVFIDMNSSLSKNSNSRLQSYKHHGKDCDELRRRRNQYNVSLRKVIINVKRKKKRFLFILNF